MMHRLSLVTLFIFLSSACGAREFVADEETRSLAVRGTGMVAASPDVAVVRLGVESREATAREAMHANNARTRAILEALKTMGAREQDVRTEALQLHPRYEHTRTADGSQNQSLVGYRASNIVSARLRDIASAGDAIDAAIQAGANRVDSIGFEVSDPTATLSAARDAAWADALQQAKQLAGLANAELGAVLRVSSNQQSSGPVHEMASVRLMMDSVPLQGGQQQLTVQIDVTWALKDGR